MPNELNPNHPTTVALHDQWYKLCALLMFKMGLTETKITDTDIDMFAASGRINITMRPMEDHILLALVTEVEAKRLAREEGGLPV